MSSSSLASTASHNLIAGGAGVAPRNPDAPASPQAGRAPDPALRGLWRRDALLLVLLATLVVLAWQISERGWLRPQDPLGYWVGVAGASMMGLLFLYPLRKHAGWMRRLGKVKGWFWFHLAMGVAGPWLILVHAGFRFGSVNAGVALCSMGAVVASGVIGRFLYVRLGGHIEEAEAALQALHRRAGLKGAAANAAGAGGVEGVEGAQRAEGSERAKGAERAERAERAEGTERAKGAEGSKAAGGAKGREDAAVAADAASPSALHYAPAVQARLQAFEARELVGEPGRLQALRQVVLLPLLRRIELWRCLRELREPLAQRALQGRWSEDEFSRRQRRMHQLIDSLLEAVMRVARHQALRRVFALWHIAHLPFIYLLVISAVVHIVAVHAY